MTTILYELASFIPIMQKNIFVDKCLNLIDKDVQSIEQTSRIKLTDSKSTQPPISKLAEFTQVLEPTRKKKGDPPSAEHGKPDP
ncbi:MAG: hypothetical protein K8F91_05510 [Candidatus Obscuribacterales bacterium]|nr:hypothetical protein [Candidatus Obscuribacterales bacterium]